MQQKQHPKKRYPKRPLIYIKRWYIRPHLKVINVIPKKYNLRVLNVW